MNWYFVRLSSYTLLGQHLQRCPNIAPALIGHVLLAGGNCRDWDNFQFSAEMAALVSVDQVVFNLAAGKDYHRIDSPPAL